MRPYQHDEFHLVPILDENGNSMLRDEFYFDGLNCNPEAFDLECELLNQQYHKNQRYDEIKCHHYIISHDPMDVADHGLTGEQAQAIGMEYAEANFPGHQALVCTHTDGSNNSGNIHTHIIINSLRKEDIAPQPYTERAIDRKAGYKHHLTKEYSYQSPAEQTDKATGVRLCTRTLSGASAAYGLAYSEQVSDH